MWPIKGALKVAPKMAVYPKSCSKLYQVLVPSSRKGQLLVLILGVCSYLVYLCFENPWRVADIDNFFQTASYLSRGKLLVNTTKCKIPDIPVSAQVLPIRDLPVCDEMPKLTYVANQTVVVNQDVLKEMGYQFHEVSCCYRIIHRVEQSEEDFDKDADNQYSLSEKCYPLDLETTPISGFITVTCTTPWLFFRKTVYEGFHMIAHFPKDDKLLQHKLVHWNTLQTQDRPPNVLLLGIDSTSRLNFHRFLNQTMQVLKAEINPVEMTGYTKVGGNTFPNIVPLLTSLSEEELEPICHQTDYHPQDDCPHIWKNFSNLNYLTAFLEDAPATSIFNYMKTGFIRKPTDMYGRPLMLAADARYYDAYCIGHQSTEEIILKYVYDLVQLSEHHKIPYFIMLWATNLSHTIPSYVRGMDQLLATILRKLQSTGLLRNTLLFVMSDHGYRHIKWRSTASGWFEDKLPVLFIKLPETLEQKHPSWLQALEYNSRQLMTPHDLHATLKDILEIAKTPKGIQASGKKVGLERAPVRGLTIFQKLPSRTCKEAGIDMEYCACGTLSTLPANITVIKKGAQFIVEQINAKIPLVCTPLKLAQITAFSKMSSGSNLNQLEQEDSRRETEYIISLVTNPGGFSYEAIVACDKRNGGSFRVSSKIQRTNKKTRTTDCLNISNFAAFELFCYCK